MSARWFAAGYRTPVAAVSRSSYPSGVPPSVGKRFQKSISYPSFAE